MSRYDSGAVGKKQKTKPCPRCYSEMVAVDGKPKTWECPRHGLVRE